MGEVGFHRGKNNRRRCKSQEIPISFIFLYILLRKMEVVAPRRLGFQLELLGSDGVIGHFSKP